MGIVIGVIIGWFVCGFFSWGILFADFQGRFPTLAVKNRRSDLGMSVLLGFFFGPIGLAAYYLTTGFAEHGFKWK